MTGVTAALALRLRLREFGFLTGRIHCPSSQFPGDPLSERFHPMAVAGRFALPLLLAGAASLAIGARAGAVGPGPGQTRAEYLTRVRESKAHARAQLFEDAKRRMEAARRWAAAARAAKRRRLPPPSPDDFLRPSPANEAGAHPSDEVDVIAQRFATHAGVTVPANLRVNSAAGDDADATRSGASIASWGDFVLVTWNGSRAPGHGYSTDEGRTFKDGGSPPAPAGWAWTGRPMVAVDEKTGTFYYCALTEAGPGREVVGNGIGVVQARFSGGALTWGHPMLARSVNSALAILDQPCLVADSTGGILYLTCTTFDAATGGHIDFQRSTDGGVTWSAPAQISSRADNGSVQGPRAAVGPAGELYAAWLAIGIGAEDHLRFRKSVSQGTIWGPEATPAALHLSIGTGAPGFDRERGVDLPSIGVDRTHGAERGRIHLAWSESIDRYDDPVNTQGSLVESEPNEFFGHATPFTPGQRLRGALGSATDVDEFSFAATQGAHYMFECDSVPDPLYTLRVFCGQDTTARLAFSGDVSVPAGGRGDLLWTAPATGIYFLRVAGMSGGKPGGYRIATGVAGIGTERARDARDVFAAWSDDGTTWSAPALVSDAAPRYAEFQPEVLVAADGMPYVTWFDWRDDGCGGRSHQYVARSSDGGTTWAPGQRFSDVQNDWARVPLGSDLPSTGDHSHLAADQSFLRPAWADGRNGRPDVYTAPIATGLDLTMCQGDLTVDAGSAVNAGWTVTNLNPLFAGSYAWTLKSQRDWPLPPAAATTTEADGTAGIHPTITVPDSAAPGANRMCLTVTDARGAQRRHCCFTVTVQPRSAIVPVLASAFDLRANPPDPASRVTRIDFSLPYDGPVQLRIYGLRGDLVRTLADGARPAGPYSVTWDGRDDRGAQAGAGAYVCRLEGGSMRVQRLIWLK